MKYTIRELETFFSYWAGSRTHQLSKRNIQISTQFWQKFNSNLKKSYLFTIGKLDKICLYGKKEMRNYFISVLFQKGMSFQIILSIKGNTTLQISCCRAYRFYGQKYMKPTE